MTPSSPVPITQARLDAIRQMLETDTYHSLWEEFTYQQGGGVYSIAFERNGLGFQWELVTLVSIVDD